VRRSEIQCNIDLIDLWNEELPKRWQAKVNAYWQARQQAYEQEQQDKERQWRERYHAHMQSDKWKDLRRKVMNRCKGICEGCGTRPAQQVHHLHYQRLGAEMLFDLVAVCLTCHEAIHGRPIG
jgi:hypothetical protein